MSKMPPSEVTITVLSGDQKGRRFKFFQNCISLGRLPHNDLALSGDHAISGEHARLVMREDTWLLEDSGSKNGTYVEQEGVFREIATATALASGQVFCLGKTELRFDSAATGDETCDEKHEDAIVLRVDLEHGQLKYQMLSCGAVGTRYSVPYRPSDVDEINGQLRSVISLAAHCKHSLDEHVQAEVRQMLSQVSGFIRQHILPRHVHDKLVESDGKGLFLVHSRALSTIPWELAAVGDTVMCLKYNFGRQVVVEGQSSIVKEKREGPTRVLFVSNPTWDLPCAQEHAESLFNRVRELCPGLRAEFLGGPRVTRVELLSRLAKSDIVYFIGHAEYDEEDPINSGWHLHRGRVTCADFRRLRTAPLLVFANGCETGREADWTDDPAPYDNAQGVASGFLLSGVESYLGAIGPVAAESSAAFADEFFIQLLKAKPMGEAVRSARTKVIEDFGYCEPVWLSFVLYGDPARKFF